MTAETAIAEREDVERSEPRAIYEAGAATPMEMLNRAVQSGASLEMVAQLMDLQERWEANQARKAFAQAFAAFKSEAIEIIRNKLVTDGPLKGRKYAELHSIVDAVTPALSKHDLSASWAITRDEKDWIEVTCTLEHVLGHYKTATMGGPPDAGGAKNPIQARGSTKTYLEKYTLKAVCGIAEQGDDVDGAGGPGAAITDEQAQAIRDFLDANNGTAEAYCKVMGVESVAATPAKRHDEAWTRLRQWAAQSKKAPPA